MKKLAIIGRPNVGKSTLFNRLVGKKQAIVDDMPGVTRDRKKATGRIGPMEFWVTDTPGLEDTDERNLEGRMFAQSMAAIYESDAVLLVVDAQAGITPRDCFFAELVRKTGVKVILAANKAEGKNVTAAIIAESWQLGFGEPIPISAEHGEGMADLYEALAPYLEEEEIEEEDNGEIVEVGDSSHIHITIAGRPNTGKSTMLNKLLGEERVLTGPEAGVTRDAISVPFMYKDQAMRLVDTAGMRRKARIEEKLEKMSVSETTHAIRFAQVVILVVDATQPFEKQDNTIASLIEREGRACVVALNKWDLIKDKKALLEDIQHKLLDVMPKMRGIPVVPISAMRGEGLDKLMEAAIRTFHLWNKRLPTGELNRWLEDIIAAHTPPLVKGRRWKIRYVTQAKTRPPTFVIFTNNKDDAPEDYLRYLVNNLREHFKLPGIPLRLLLRTSKNPFVDK